MATIIEKALRSDRQRLEDAGWEFTCRTLRGDEFFPPKGNPLRGIKRNGSQGWPTEDALPHLKSVPILEEVRALGKELQELRHELKLTERQRDYANSQLGQIAVAAPPGIFSCERGEVSAERKVKFAEKVASILGSEE